jgi:hypothetical protein
MDAIHCNVIISILIACHLSSDANTEILGIDNVVGGCLALLIHSWEIQDLTIGPRVSYPE